MEIYSLGHGPTSTIIYGAAAEMLVAGIATQGGQVFPEIDLHYPTETRLSMAKIAREMWRRHLLPSVYIWGNDIAVLFELKPVKPTFLQQLHKPTPPEIYRSLEPDTRLIATGEAEMDPRVIAAFMDKFRETGYFRLSIAAEIRAGKYLPPLWSKDLQSFSSEAPYRAWMH